MNLAIVLKDEIRRLARKEIRAQTATVKRTSASQRREIAQLKRQFKGIERRMTQLIEQLRSSGNRAAPGGSERSANRFSARSVRAQRRRLRLSAAEYGKLIGVSGQTIYQWEHGNSRPRRSQMAALVAVRLIGRRAALARLAEGGKK